MHLIVAWGYDDEATPEQRDAANSAFRECLKGFSWVRPLNQPIYLVELKAPSARKGLKDALVAVAKNHTLANLLVSPVLPDGQYGGWLPRSMWPKIRKRTGQPEKD